MIGWPTKKSIGICMGWAHRHGHMEHARVCGERENVADWQGKASAARPAVKTHPDMRNL